MDENPTGRERQKEAKRAPKRELYQQARGRNFAIWLQGTLKAFRMSELPALTKEGSSDASFDNQESTFLRLDATGGGAPVGSAIGAFASRTTT